MAKRISDRKTDSSIRRFMLSKVNRRLIYVLLLLVAVILVGVFADRIAPYPYMKANFQAKMKELDAYFSQLKEEIAQVRMRDYRKTDIIAKSERLVRMLLEETCLAASFMDCVLPCALL